MAVCCGLQVCSPKTFTHRKYRTRCGDYALQGVTEIQSEVAEQNLLQSVEAIATHVGKAASVSATTIFCRLRPMRSLVRDHLPQAKCI